MKEYELKIDKSVQELYVIENGEVVGIVPCSTGTGIPANGYDCVTPEGVYSVTKIVDSRDLGWEGDPTGQRRPYGPWMFNLSIDGIAIHGTDEPKNLGTPVTHGCIRVSDYAIVILRKNYVKEGTLVEIIGGK